MRKHVACYRERVWAGEGNNGAGRPLAQRLLADGEHVVDLRAKLSARACCWIPGTTERPTRTTPQKGEKLRAEETHSIQCRCRVVAHRRRASAADSGAPVDDRTCCRTEHAVR
jgi:hypothetical protein